jgi:carbonic anhydrase
LKERTADKQEPFAAVLACADSRVPVELIFDQTIGHLFVTRIAGNMVTLQSHGQPEYGVAALGVKVLLVLGHTNCGAVKAAMNTDTVPGQISVLYQHLRPAVEKSGGNLDRAIEFNTQHQARTSADIFHRDSRRDKRRTPKCERVYDLAAGAVELK